MAKWVANIKGRPMEGFEISVLRDDNDHGKRSYGWIDDTKILISSSGGPCSYRIPKLVFDKLVKVAHEVAQELNDAEQV